MADESPLDPLLPDDPTLATLRASSEALRRRSEALAKRMAAIDRRVLDLRDAYRRRCEEAANPATSSRDGSGLDAEYAPPPPPPAGQ